MENSKLRSTSNLISGCYAISLVSVVVLSNRASGGTDRTASHGIGWIQPHFASAENQKYPSATGSQTKKNIDNAVIAAMRVDVEEHRQTMNTKAPLGSTVHSKS